MEKRRVRGSHRRGRRGVVVVTAAALAAAAAVAPSPASAAVKRFTSTAKADGATATVTGTVKGGDIKMYRGMVFTLRSASGKVLRKSLTGIARESWGVRPSVTLADASGDGKPDAFVDVWTGGAHCCIVSTISVSTPTGGWRKPFRTTWDSGYSLKDLGTRDGVKEIISVDPRFDYLFASHAESALPVTIQHLTPEGGLTDVATQFPARLRTDADEWIQAWKDAAPKPGESAEDAEFNGYVQRSTLGAALADLLQLGALDEAKDLSAQAVARGDFAHIPAKKEDQLFEVDVAHQLQKMGFLTDWSVLGLPQ